MKDERFESDGTKTSNPEGAQSNSISNKVNIAETIAIEAVKILITGSLVSGVLFPFDISLYHLHRKDKSSVNFGRVSMYGMLIKHLPTLVPTLVTPYLQSFKALTKKVTFLGQAQNELFSSEPNDKSVKALEETGLSAKQKPAFLQGLFATLTLGLIETILTQNNSNRFKYQLEAMRNSSFVIPNPTTFINKCNAYMVGFKTRAANNCIRIGAFVAQPWLEGALNNHFLKGYRPEYSTFSAAVIAGGIQGLIGNTLEIINKAQVSGTSPVTFKGPGAFKAMKQLIEKEGGLALVKGLPASGIRAIVAQMALPTAMSISEKAIGKLQNVRYSFFKMPNVTAAVNENAASQEPKTNSRI